MDFFFGLVKVLVGVFVMFQIANASLKAANIEKPFGWFLLIGVMSLSVMLLYKFIGHSVSVPVYTVLAFIVVLNGISSNFKNSAAELVDQVAKKARWYAAAGGIIGWLAYGNIV